MLLLCAFALSGCETVKVSARAQKDCAPGTPGCTIIVEKGGFIRPYMGYMVDKQVTPSGQVLMNIAVNHSNASLVQTTLPAVVSAVGGWQAATVQAAAIRFAAKQKGDGINIYNQGGDAVALQQTSVDVVQGPTDPDVDIDEIHLWPEDPGQ